MAAAGVRTFGFASSVTLALLVALGELGAGWRFSLFGASPDVLFILAAAVAARARPGHALPASVALGLLGDFLLGERLGLMALGYCFGIWALGVLRSRFGRWDPTRGERVPVRAGAAFVLLLAAGLASHGTSAALGWVLGLGELRGRLALALWIAILTAAAGAVLWPLFDLLLTFQTRPPSVASAEEGDAL